MANPHRPDTTHISDYCSPDVYVVCIMSPCVSVCSQGIKKTREIHAVRQQCQQHQPFIDQSPSRDHGHLHPQEQYHRPSATSFEQPSKAQHPHCQFPLVFGVHHGSHDIKGGATFGTKTLTTLYIKRRYYRSLNPLNSCIQEEVLSRESKPIPSQACLQVKVLCVPENTLSGSPLRPRDAPFSKEEGTILGGGAALPRL